MVHAPDHVCCWFHLTGLEFFLEHLLSRRATGDAFLFSELGRTILRCIR